MRIVGDISNEKTRYATSIVETDKEKKFLQEAQEALQEYDDCFAFKKPSCEELSGKVIFCCEMDLFELYICVLLKELKHGYSIRNVVWNHVEISGRQVVYPYIEEIWDVIVKEYAEKTCSKVKTNCVFSRRVKRCGKEPENKEINLKMESDLIFYINSEEERENKYDDLIAFLLMHSKDLYDMMIESIENADLVSGIEGILKELLIDWYGTKIESDVAGKVYEIMETKRKKYLERKLSNRNDNYLNNNHALISVFWDRISVCSKWKEVCNRCIIERL